MSLADPIREAVAFVEAGVWVAGVSGGADSVALLCALRATRPDVRVVVAHVDHETRAGASSADAAFVASLCQSLDVSCVAETWSRLGGGPGVACTEAAYRAARLRHFRNVADAHAARGVLLAHHADDRAETVLLRLLRHAEPWALGGIRREAQVGGLRVVRPLLSLRREMLRAYLDALGQSWRDDGTNTQPLYARNRVRTFLTARPALVGPLLALADASDAYRASFNVPDLAATFACNALADLPDPVARQAARRWLIARGAPSEACTADVTQRLLAMTRDASTPVRADFPGSLRVVRRRGRIQVDDATR